MTFTPTLFAGCGMCFAATLTCHGAIQLLTGDSNNGVHQSSASLLDLSADGDYVFFSTSPPVTGSTPGITEGGYYVRKLSANTLTFVGDNSVPGGAEASFSDNGRYLTWRGTDDFIYWRDSISDDTRLITPAADGASRRPVMSADGRYVAYASVARNIVSNSGKLQPAGHPGVYLYDSSTETTTVVSLTKTGAALNTGVGAAGSVATAGNEFDFSTDGKYIVFSSDATNVHPNRPSDYPAGFVCIYRRNLSTGAVDLLNKNSGGSVSDGNFYSPRVSANGSRITFFGSFVGLSKGVGMSNKVSNTFGIDMYVKDAASGDVWWATKTINNSNSDGVYSPFNAISGDGETVSFGSTGTNFVTANTDPAIGNSGTSDVFRVDLLGGGTVKTSLVTSSPNGSGNVVFRVGPLLPGNGDYVAFCTSQVEAMLGTGSEDTINFQGFSVSAPPVAKKPEIDVQQPENSSLVDGTSKKSFGTMVVGKSGAAKNFIIKNAGNANLTGLKISVSGTHKNDFSVTALAKTSLGDGEITSFKVTFKPKAKGTRNAVVSIDSNDANENPFDIKVTGLGKP